MENSKNKIVGIIDYGINNINSVKNSLTRLNTNFKVINSKIPFLRLRIIFFQELDLLKEQCKI